MPILDLVAALLCILTVATGIIVLYRILYRQQHPPLTASEREQQLQTTLDQVNQQIKEIQGD